MLCWYNIREDKRINKKKFDLLIELKIEFWIKKKIYLIKKIILVFMVGFQSYDFKAIK